MSHHFESEKRNKNRGDEEEYTEIHKFIYAF